MVINSRDRVYDWWTTIERSTRMRRRHDETARDQAIGRRLTPVTFDRRAACEGCRTGIELRRPGRDRAHGFRLCVVVALAAFSFSSGVAALRAQTPDSAAGIQAGDTPVVQLTGIRVQVSRLSLFGIEAARAPFFASFLSRDQVRASSVLTAADALGALPGVHANDELGAPYQPDITLRGFTVSPVVGLPQSLSVFVDGVRVNEPDASQVHFDLIPLGDIERVEVIRGPSGPFGRNTLAGALNIVTRRGGPGGRTELELSGGNWGRLGAEASTGGTMGPFDYYASGRYFRSDGWRDVTGARLVQAFGKLGYRDDRNDAWISYAFASDSIEQAGSLPVSWLRGSVPGDFAGIDDPRTINFTGGDFFSPLLHFVTASYSRQLTLRLVGQAQAFYRANEIEQFNVNISEANSRGLSDLWSAGITTQLSYQIRPELVLLGGLEYERDDVNARIFAEPNAADPDSGMTTHVTTKQDEVGAFAQLSWSPGDRLLLMGSLRYDQIRVPFRDRLDPSNDGTNTFRQATWSGGANYALSDLVNVYGSYGRGFRAPVILELACADPEDPCPLPFELGADPPLDPVTTDTWQAGLRLAGGPLWSLELSGYWSEVHDDIFNVTTGATTRGFFRNLDRTRRQGLDLEARFQPDSRFTLSGDLSYTRATFQTRDTLFAPFLDEEGGEPGAELDPPVVEPGDRFPLIPDLRAGVAVTYDDGPWRLALEGEYLGAQWLRGDEHNSDEDARVDPHVLVSVRVERDIGPLDLYARVENVFDASYETFGVIASNPRGPGEPLIEPFYTPGFPRRVFAGARWRW